MKINKKKIVSAILISCTVISQIITPIEVDAQTKNQENKLYSIKNVVTEEYLNLSKGNKYSTIINISQESNLQNVITISDKLGEDSTILRFDKNNKLIENNEIPNSMIGLFGKHSKANPKEHWSITKVGNKYHLQSSGYEENILITFEKSDLSDANISTYSESESKQNWKLEEVNYKVENNQLENDQNKNSISKNNKDIKEENNDIKEQDKELEENDNPRNQSSKKDKNNSSSNSKDNNSKNNSSKNSSKNKVNKKPTTSENTSSNKNNKTKNKSVSQIKSQITSTYKKVKSSTGRSNFKHQCSLYVYSQLKALKIYQVPDTYWNGSQWYYNINSNARTSTGYKQKKYSGVNCLNKLIKANDSENVYNVVVSFPKSYRSSSKVGHVMFIHAIINGQVYYSDNYNYAGKPEGSVIVKSVGEFTKYFSSNYGGINGAIHFKK